MKNLRLTITSLKMNQLFPITGLSFKSPPLAIAEHRLSHPSLRTFLPSLASTIESHFSHSFVNLKTHYMFYKCRGSERPVLFMKDQE